MSKDNRIIFLVHIGKFNKPNGGILNLYECHFIVCTTNHNNIICVHDVLQDIYLIINYLK